MIIVFRRPLRYLVPVAVGSVVSALLVGASISQQARADVITSAVVADSFIASDQPNTVLNTSWVSMDASPARYGYFRFTVTVPAGQKVSSAEFRCYAGSSNSSGASLWAVAGTWSETTLTWSNAPVANFSAPPAGSTGAVTSGTYASANVTSAIPGSGTYTLVSRTVSSTQWSCASKESGRPAQLVVNTVADTPATTPPATTPPVTTPPVSTPPTTTTPPPPPATTTLLTSADAFIASDQPSTAHNTSWVSMDLSPRRNGYFRFDVSVPSGQRVTSAVFRCYAGSSNSSGASLWTTGSAWSESTLTWNNAPQPDYSLPATASTGAVSRGVYASANVTSAVAGSGSYTFVTRTSSNKQWSCEARESSHPAQLVLTTVGTTPTSTPTPTTTPTTTPPTTPPTSTTPPPIGGSVVDAIGDGGPDAAHWNSPLAARLRADNPAVFLWPGDVRMTGTPAEWRLYDDNYGALKPVTLPTPGNHDWGNATSGYDIEFGTGAPYADIDTYCNGITLANGWGMFSINSYDQANCLPKLKTFLATPGTRKIVVTHEPRYSGGSHGSDTAQDAIWQAMRGHAFAMVAGHDHDAQIIERDGLVQVVNGCAGADYYSVTPITGTVYYSTSAADCTFQRFTLGTNTVTLQAVHADGSIDFTKTYSVTP